ncbi:NAD(P)-dependent oxidoreductase [Nitrososphaera viennensis]|uniref:NAD(P)-dependent oxidoreductase n=1 Tax=Nitrososphaera viennensis TaxID=1034015 RepID=A0A977IGK4_9ARCH|nr:NAD(P)-dependent oxidoreductase [Nitrososphaera viennensis]UVS70357.1 NAD(P)-dependent oxidoreductase [Nitrososphaera viennensis]
MKVGIAGLGLMGSGIAKRLISTGHDVWVYNRDRSKTGPFSKDARVAASPIELASNCDLVITIVTNFDAVREVFFGDAGIAKSKDAPAIIADASTISPEQSAYCAQELRKGGIEMLGMPVMGGPAAAEAGELVPMVAGNRQAFEKARPVMEKMGKHVFYISEKDGAANAVKLALNLNIALIATAVSEGITLVKGSGIDPAVFVQVLNSTYFKTGLSEKKGPLMVANDYEPSFHLKNMLKDLELANDTAQAHGITLPTAALVQQMFRAANNSGYSEMDYTAICAFLAKINGMEGK